MWFDQIAQFWAEHGNLILVGIAIFWAAAGGYAATIAGTLDEAGWPGVEVPPPYRHQSSIGMVQLMLFIQGPVGLWIISSYPKPEDED